MSTLTHGHARRGKKTRSYFAWQDMKKRCYWKASPDYKNYGGRGITVCREWRNDYQQFFSDMGEPLAGMVFDRINNDGHYCKANCRWVTRAESNRNKRTVRFVPFMGQTKTIKEWERELGFGGGTIRLRLLKGMSVEDALTRRRRFNGLTEGREDGTAMYLSRQLC